MGHNQNVASCTLDFFTAKEIEDIAQKYPKLAYTLYYNICHLPEAQANYLRNWYDNTVKLGARMAERCRLVSDIG